MEICSMVSDRQNQYYKNTHTAESYTASMQCQSKYFKDIEKRTSRFIWNHKRPRRE